MRQLTPTNPEQLGWLAMVLVRLDRHENYKELLEKIHWMGDYAIGHLVKVPGGLGHFYTPGLLRVIDEVGENEAPIGTSALELALELTSQRNLEFLKMRRTIAG